MLRRLLLGASLMTSPAIYIGLKIVAHQRCHVIVANVNRHEIASKTRTPATTTHIVKIIALPPEVEKMVTNRRCREREKNNDPRYSSGRVRKFEKSAHRVSDGDNEPNSTTFSQIDPDVENTLTSHRGTVGNTPSIAEVKTKIFSDMPLKEKLSRVDLDARLRVIHEKTPKAGQLLVIETLFDEETGVILIAKTGYGKSMVFYSVSALEEDTMTLMIMHLLALEEDQKASIKKMQANSNPCILNGETMTKDLHNEIHSGPYTHVLTCPEIAISNKEFRQVLQHPNVQQGLVIVAIDEVHLVEDWGSWRKDYYKPGELRSVVPRRVPFFAMSATLDNVLLKKIIAALRFAEDVRVIRESIKISGSYSIGRRQAV